MPQKKTRLGRALIVAGAIGFVGMIFVMLARVEPIEVVNTRLKHTGSAVFVEGMVKNTGPDIGAIGLQIRYYDANGRKLAEDEVRLAGLRGGAETTFKSPVRELTDARDFTVYVNRGRNPYGN